MAGFVDRILGSHARLSDWAHWVAHDQNPGATEVRRFLEHAMSCVAPAERNRLEKELIARQSSQVDDLLMELVAHHIFYQFGFSPALYPKTRTGLTPDLSIVVRGKRFLADIFVTNSPVSTVTRRTDTAVEVRDGGERARKVAAGITAKAVKYAACGDPLLVVIFLGDHHILDPSTVAEALYGVQFCEFDENDRYPVDFLFDGRMGGCILPTEHEPTPHPALSAVLVCDWFDTLNRRRPGKRIHCTVFHHYEPMTAFPLGALHPFCEFFWEPDGERMWRPSWHGIAERVNVFETLVGQV